MLFRSHTPKKSRADDSMLKPRLSDVRELRALFARNGPGSWAGQGLLPSWCLGGGHGTGLTHGSRGLDAHSPGERDRR